MKPFVSLFLAFILTLGLSAQEPVTSVQEPDTMVKPAEKEKIVSPVINVEDKNDTITVRVGKKGVKIYESDKGTSVEIIPMEENKTKNKKHKRKRFEGHWEGLEIGMNNFLTPDYTYPDNFLNLNTGKSWNINLNFLQYDVGIIGNSVGLVTGLGLQFNDYKFSGNHSIAKDSTGSVVMLAYADPLKMTKLNIGYLTLPLLMEFHFGRSFYMAGGVIGSMKIRSYTKVKYYEEGKITKNKVRDDFAISPLQYEATVRFGINELNVYANYNLSPLFQKNKGPELYPFSVGLAVRFD
ncbi:MAG: outer membrane beta-barrel protein [Chlorobi bacterium]|nr:outer membrane beta-barrel protein [Chlorobiota bacterium]